MNYAALNLNLYSQYNRYIYVESFSEDHDYKN